MWCSAGRQAASTFVFSRSVTHHGRPPRARPHRQPYRRQVPPGDDPGSRRHGHRLPRDSHLDRPAGGGEAAPPRARPRRVLGHALSPRGARRSGGPPPQRSRRAGHGPGRGRPRLSGARAARGRYPGGVPGGSKATLGRRGGALPGARARRARRAAPGRRGAPRPQACQHLSGSRQPWRHHPQVARFWRRQGARAAVGGAGDHGRYRGRHAGLHGS